MPNGGDTKIFDIGSRAQQFAVGIIEIVRTFPKDPASYVVGKQIIRSSTSVGANIVEAHAALTRKEFIYCMNIAKREAKETLYWLAIIEKSHLVALEKLIFLQQECHEIVSVLVAIVKKSQGK